MKFIITTCIFSQSQKPKAAPNINEFLSENEILITPSTLLDIELGIARCADTDPARAARLREWLEDEKGRFDVVGDNGEDFQKALAGLVACKALQGQWAWNPAAKQFVFRQALWVAAAAITKGLPIATKSMRVYCEIDQHVRLPGIYNPIDMVWHTRKPARPKRPRIKRGATNAEATAFVLPVVEETISLPPRMQ